ncbi:hypothetical protein DIPPA_07149 [Diplonema papillatum]|nr:hypothetical protein DIPPA_07149 [Diplonema papillatum]
MREETQTGVIGTLVKSINSFANVFSSPRQEQDEDRDAVNSAKGVDSYDRSREPPSQTISGGRFPPPNLASPRSDAGLYNRTTPSSYPVPSYERYPGYTGTSSSLGGAAGNLGAGVPTGSVWNESTKLQQVTMENERLKKDLDAARRENERQARQLLLSQKLNAEKDTMISRLQNDIRKRDRDFADDSWADRQGPSKRQRTNGYGPAKRVNGSYYDSSDVVMSYLKKFVAPTAFIAPPVQPLRVASKNAELLSQSSSLAARKAKESKPLKTLAIPAASAAVDSSAGDAPPAQVSSVNASTPKKAFDFSQGAAADAPPSGAPSFSFGGIKKDFGAGRLSIQKDSTPASLDSTPNLAADRAPLESSEKTGFDKPFDLSPPGGKPLFSSLFGGGGFDAKKDEPEKQAAEPAAADKAAAPAAKPAEAPPAGGGFFNAGPPQVIFDDSNLADNAGDDEDDDDNNTTASKTAAPAASGGGFSFSGAFGGTADKAKDAPNGFSGFSFGAKPAAEAAEEDKKKADPPAAAAEDAKPSPFGGLSAFGASVPPPLQEVKKEKEDDAGGGFFNKGPAVEVTFDDECFADNAKDDEEGDDEKAPAAPAAGSGFGNFSFTAAAAPAAAAPAAAASSSGFSFGSFGAKPDAGTGFSTPSMTAPAAASSSSLFGSFAAGPAPPSIFGSTAPAASSSDSGPFSSFTFGASASTATEPAKADAPAASSSGGFGSSFFTAAAPAAAEPATAPPGKRARDDADDEPKAKMFSFGGAGASGGFSLGAQPAASAASTGGGFSFPAATANGEFQFSGFSADSSSSSGAAAPSSSAFGGGFTFGAASSAAADAFQPAAASASPFAFGASTTPAAAAAPAAANAFSFGQQAAPAQAGGFAFSLDTKGDSGSGFSFGGASTGQPPAFTASAASSLPQRKYRVKRV